MHSDASLEALGYHFGSGTEDLVARQAIKVTLSCVGPLRFSDLAHLHLALLTMALVTETA